MRIDQGSWGKVIRGGLSFGGAAVFVSLTGMVEALGVREIVIGVIDLGRLLLLLIGTAHNSVCGARLTAASISR